MAISAVLCTTIMALLRALCQARLSKPIVAPPMPPLDEGLWENLTPTQSTRDQWGRGWMPEVCKSLALERGYSPYDVEIFNIHYVDVSRATNDRRSKNFRNLSQCREFPRYVA